MTYVNVDGKMEFKKVRIFTDSRFIDVETEIELNDQRYKIKEIRTVLYDKTIEMTNPPGFNMYRIGKLLNYNSEIALFVEEI